MSAVFLTGNGIMEASGVQNETEKLQGLSEINEPTSGSDGIRIVIHPPGTCAHRWKGTLFHRVHRFLLTSNCE